MKRILLLILLIAPVIGFSQNAESAFHLASNQYIHGKMPEAKATIDNALRLYPNDQKLRELRSKIKEDEKQDQQKQDQEKQDQQNQEQEQKNKEQQQKKDQQDKQDKDSQEQQKKDQQKKEEQQQQEQQQNENQEKRDQQKKEMNLDPNKLKEMKISEEKARMILEAMRNQEKQYLQQLKRKSSKPRDRNKPDW